MKSKIGGSINKEGDLKTELKILRSSGYDYAEFGFCSPKRLVEEYKKNYKEYSNILPVSVSHLPKINFIKEGIKEIEDFIADHLEIGCKNFVFHFFTTDSPPKDGVRPEKIAWLKKLADFAQERKVNLILENTFDVGVGDVDKIFKEVKGIWFCLDMGHANLTEEKDRSINLLSAFGEKLKHIHAHDNLGGPGEPKNDLHLPIGFGNIDFPMIFKKLKGINYSGNITLEVHRFERKYRKISLGRIKELL